MKTFSRRFQRFGLGALGALALVAASAVTTTGAVGDSTVGGLPSADDGDGTQNFYLRAPRELADDLIVDAWGEGFYVVVALPDEEISVEFYGNVTVQFDRDLLLAHSGKAQVGMNAGIVGSGMLVIPEIDGQLSGRTFSIGAGSSFATPLDRINPLLSGSLLFHTTQAGIGTRGEVEYIGMDGLLAVQQKL